MGILVHEEKNSHSLFPRLFPVKLLVLMFWVPTWTITIMAYQLYDQDHVCTYLHNCIMKYQDKVRLSKTYCYAAATFLRKLGKSIR